MSKKVKTYWDEIKNRETFYYGGDYGWEVHLRYSEYNFYNNKTGKYEIKKKLEFQWPYFNKSIPRSERKKCREEVLLKRKKERILAQASRNRDEYRDLQARVDEENWNNIIDIANSGCKGFDLGNYIRSKYLTRSEAYSLFYRM